MKTILLFLLATTVAISSASATITLSSKDDFALTSEGWSIGGAGVQPTRVASIGPDGQVGYLSHYSDSGGANGKWLMWSDDTKWQGDYTAAGVTAISLQANLTGGTTPANLRMAFNGPGGWFYSTSQSVVAGWNSYSFELLAENFTFTTGSPGDQSFANTLSGITRFEILAGAGGVSYASNGNLLRAGTSTHTVALDDIRAVPEPTTCGLVCLALVASLWLRKKITLVG
jgi:hypothetical protein